MKKLTLLAVLILFSSGLALAQSPQDMGNAPTPGATFVTGVVVSSNADNLIIRNDVGELVTVFLVDSTVGARDRTAGTRVKVNYHLEDARAIADEILGYDGGVPPEPKAQAPAVVVTESTPVVVPPPPAPVVEPEPVPEPAPVVDTTPEPAPAYEPAPAATYEEPSEELPATASNLGLIALLGFMALAAAVVIRVVR